MILIYFKTLPRLTQVGNYYQLILRLKFIEHCYLYSAFKVDFTFQFQFLLSLSNYPELKRIPLETLYLSLFIIYQKFGS